MNLFNKRPLLLALLFFILINSIASAVPYYMRLCGVLFCPAAATILIIITVIAKLQKSEAATAFFTIALVVSFCAIAFANSYRFIDRHLTNIENLSEAANITAEIEECTYSAKYTSVYIAKITEVNGKEVNFRAELSSEGPTEFESRDIITASANFSKFSTDNNGFNERTTNIADNILTSATFTDAEVTGKAKSSVPYFFKDVRDSLAKRIDRGSLDNSASLAKALLLGDRDDLASGTSLNFRRMGISHILSISGTHFTILLGTLAIILANFGLSKKVIYTILIPLAVFYMGLTGFSAPVCRAGIMAIIAYSGFFFGRTKDSYTALCIAVTVIMLISPETVYSVSLWLSFAATFSILILTELFGKAKSSFVKRSKLKSLVFGIVSNFSVSVFVSIVTLPIVASIFGEISIISPVANVVLIPLFTVFLYIAPFSVLLPNFTPLSFSCDLIADIISKISDFLCGFDNLLISVKQWFVLPISTVCLIAMLVMIALPLRRPKLVLIPPAVCVFVIAVGICIFNHIHFDKTSITYFTSGDNDGMVINSQNEALCIDISSGASAPAYKAESIAEEYYCPEITGFMFTHYHQLHINMFTKLCARTRVHAVYLPVPTNKDSLAIMESIRDIAESNRTKVVLFDYDTPTVFEGCTLTVYTPIYLKRSTHPVINMQIETDNSEILYLGSSFAETDFDYIDIALDAEYLIFGQHSPVAKKEFSVETKALTIYGDETHSALSHDKNQDILLSADSQYEIVLK